MRPPPSPSTTTTAPSPPGLRGTASRRLSAELPRHTAFLRRVARSLVADAADADDLVQETLLAALESPPRADPTETPRLRAWLSRVLRNRALNRRRDAERRARHLPRLAVRPEPATALAGDTADRLATALDLLGAIESLAAPKRDALLLRYFENLAPREIAARLGEPVGTVKTRLKRGLAELRERLAERHGEDRWRATLAATFGVGNGPGGASSRPAPSSAHPVPRSGVLALGGVLVTTTQKISVAAMALLLLGFAWWGGGDGNVVSPTSEERAESATATTPEVPARRRVRASAGDAGAPAVAADTALLELPGPPVGGAVVRGRVVDTSTDAPIPDATVRWGVLAQPGLPRQRAAVRDRETRADGAGRFLLEIAPPVAGRELSLDVVASGYGSAVGRTSRLVDPQSRLALERGSDRVVTLRLRPAVHAAGVVRDVHGAPIPGVEVEATERDAQGYTYVASTRTDGEGRFRVVDFEAPRAAGVAPSRAHLAFEHPDYLAAEVADCHALDPAARETLEIVLSRGFDVAGRVFAAEGGDVGGLLVEAFDAAGTRLRGADTDGAGAFTLPGIPEGGVRIRVIDAAGVRRGSLTLDVFAPERGLEVRLDSLPGTAPVRHRLLGLDLADLTPEVRAGLDVPDERVGVCVLAATVGHAALGIGTLRPGDRLLRVGGRDATCVRDVVDALLETVARGPRPDGAYSTRVVYAFRRPDFVGTNTQVLRVTAAQVDELRRWRRDHE